jgi:hypothetical protein
MNGPYCWKVSISEKIQVESLKLTNRHRKLQIPFKFTTQFDLPMGSLLYLRSN